MSTNEFLTNLVSNEPLYSPEFKDYILSLHINFFVKKNLHETIQHLNEMLLIKKNKDLYYVIFSTNHFLFEYLKQDDYRALSGFYLPDAIIYNSVKNKIEYTIQYKTIFNQIYSDRKLQLLNEKYDHFFTDKIKINYFNKKFYYDQFIDHTKYPRIMKTNISQEFILENKIKINDFLKERKNMQEIYEHFSYRIMTNKFLNYSKYIK